MVRHGGTPQADPGALLTDSANEIVTPRILGQEGEGKRDQLPRGLSLAKLSARLKDSAISTRGQCGFCCKISWLLVISHREKDVRKCAFRGLSPAEHN